MATCVRPIGTAWRIDGGNSSERRPPTSSQALWTPALISVEEREVGANQGFASRWTAPNELVAVWEQAETAKPRRNGARDRCAQVVERLDRSVAAKSLEHCRRRVRDACQRAAKRYLLCCEIPEQVIECGGYSARAGSSSSRMPSRSAAGFHEQLRSDGEPPSAATERATRLDRRSSLRAPDLLVVRHAVAASDEIRKLPRTAICSRTLRG